MGCCVTLFMLIGFPLLVIAIAHAESFVINLSNHRKIEVTEYSIDLERDRIQFRTAATGLNYTIPLEYLETVKDESGLLFRNERLVKERQTVDDGGIAANFKVTATTVGSGAGSSGGRSQNPNASPNQHYVDPYQKSDGTNVSGHWKTNPNETETDNLSYRK